MVKERFGLPAATAAQEPAGVPDEGGGLLADRVRTGAMWMVGSAVLLRLSNIAIMAVVARIVAPDAFGVFALAVTLHVVLVNVAELGVASAIPRVDLDVDKVAPTVITISVGSSMVLGSLMAIFAEPLASGLGSADAAESIRILSISVALIGWFAVPGAQLQREFRQNVIFRASLIAFFPASAVLMILAMLGDGAAAFAWSRVVGHFVTGIIMFASVTRRHRPGLNLGLLRPLLRFGVPLAVANLLSQLLLNIDYVFVGHLMSTVDVGLYMLAFNVSSWSTGVIGSALTGVVLPAFSTVKRDNGDVPAALAHAVRTVALIAFPLAGFTCAFATPLITTVYGDQWAAAGPVLMVLSFYGAVYVIGLLFANIIISTGRTWVLFAVQTAALACLIPALISGVRLGGLVGVGLAHVIVIGIVTLPAYVIALRRSTGVGLALILKAVWRPFIAAATAAVVAWSVTLPLQSDLLRLGVGGLVGAAIYFLISGRLLLQVLPKLGNIRPKVFRVSKSPIRTDVKDG
jgi:lipopolysaccharide exporter